MSILLSSALSPVQASEGQGVPLGVPSVVRNVSVATPVTSDTATVRWETPTANGGSAITGYSAVALTGSDFTTRTSSTCSVSGSTFSCTLFGLAFGSTYKIEVVATNAIGSSTPVLSAPFTIDALPQTVTISGAPTSVTFGNTGSQLSASATSNLPVVWSSLTTNCTVDNTGRVTYSAIGACTVQALQDGSGSIYAADSETATIQVGLNLTASATGASSIAGTSATLNGNVPFPGSDATVRFCISTVNSNATCSSPSGVTVGVSSPSTITASSATLPTSSVTGLTAAQTYFYWVEATVGATTVKSSTQSFTTLSAPTLTRSGPTTGQANSPFSTTINASGGSGVYLNWGVSTLPTGLILSPSGSTATITGTPTAAGTTTSVITVTDSNDVSSNLTVIITIVAEPTPQQEEEEVDTTKSDEEVVDLTPKKPGEIGGIQEITEIVVEQGSTEPERPAAGNYVILRDGAPSLIDLKVIDERILSFTGPELSLNLEIRNANNQVRPFVEEKVPQARIGDFISVTGFGYIPGTRVNVWLLSTPTLIGRVEVSPLGSFQGSLPVPKDFPLGKHTLQINGISSKNEVVSLSVGLEVIAGLQEPAIEPKTPIIDPDEKIVTTKVVRAILFAKGASKPDKAERMRIKKAKKLINEITSVVKIRCVFYSPKKKTTSSERKVAKSIAKALCSRFIGNRGLSFDTIIKPIKRAPMVKRKLTAKKSIRVDIVITRRVTTPAQQSS